VPIFSDILYFENIFAHNCYDLLKRRMYLTPWETRWDSKRSMRLGYSVTAVVESLTDGSLSRVWSGTACKVQGCLEGDDRRQMSAALSNRRELERYYELVNTTDNDRVENVAWALGNSKSFGL